MMTTLPFSVPPDIRPPWPIYSGASALRAPLAIQLPMIEMTYRDIKSLLWIIEDILAEQSHHLVQIFYLNLANNVLSPLDYFLSFFLRKFFRTPGTEIHSKRSAATRMNRPGFRGGCLV
jgi:hypothetical protein